MPVVAEADVNGQEPVVEGPALRARLVALTVQLQAVVDDGLHEYVTPLQIAPIQINAADWPTFDLDMHLADVQRQLDESRFR